MSRDNSLWGEERIANELLVKLGIRVSPRTVRKYMRRKRSRGPRGDQRWRTFLRNHAAAIVACDFCVAVTARFRVLYIFVIIEHASRRLLHWDVTSNPTAAWRLQQLREAIASDHLYEFLVHDRDSIYTRFLRTTGSESRTG
jgi:hypothetical protein